MRAFLTIKPTPKSQYIVLLVVVLTFCLFSCRRAQEFPSGDNPDSTLVSTDVVLSLELAVDMPIDIQTKSLELPANKDLRFTLDIFPAPKNKESELGQRVVRMVYTEGHIDPKGSVLVTQNVSLRAEPYLVMVWIDWVAKGTQSDLHYDTRDLTAIRMLDGNGFRSDKEAFCGSASLDLSPYRGQRVVHHTLNCSVSRPLAAYEIVATDLDKYLQRVSAPYALARPNATQLNYQLYTPQGFNVRTDQPAWLTPQVGYAFQPVDSMAQHKVVLASDYVFVADQAYFHVDGQVRDAQNKLISTFKNLKINLRRNRKTILYGEFLTQSVSGSGIGVDEGFSDEFIVPIP